jgi:hypothetical protein
MEQAWDGAHLYLLFSTRVDFFHPKEWEVSVLLWMKNQAVTNLNDYSCCLGVDILK